MRQTITTQTVIIMVLAASTAAMGEPKHFENNMESLRHYECPERFRDAKFGIWAHWGPQPERQAARCCRYSR